MSIMPNLLYTQNDEWVHAEGNIATYGITYYAQNELSDIVFLELPSVGDIFNQGDPIGTVESVKAVAELYMPLSGQILEVNEDLLDQPEEVNNDPYGAWLVRIQISDPNQLKSLLNADAYDNYRRSHDE